jgi:hypothetical protein
MKDLIDLFWEDDPRAAFGHLTDLLAPVIVSNFPSRKNDTRNTINWGRPGVYDERYPE